LTGYRVGFHQGYVGGERKRESEKPFPKVYAVADLVMPKHADPSTAMPDYDSLIQSITDTVAVESWDTVGGLGVISAMPSNQTLVISQTEDVHERIDNLLRGMRQATAISK